MLSDTGYKYKYVEALKKIGNRDIVDFVQLNEFDPITLRNKFGKTLESDTLEEIPTHFKRFVQIHNILPPNHIATQIENGLIYDDNKEMENINYNYNGKHKRAPSNSNTYDTQGTHYQKGYKTVSTNAEKQNEPGSNQTNDEKIVSNEKQCDCCCVMSLVI